MRRRFDGVYVAGADAVREALSRGPVIVAANHVAWWDPLFAVLLDDLLGCDSYALMDERNLARLPFFGWVGALPVSRETPRRSLAQLRASATLLDRPGRALWIFPQGDQRPAHLRPLGMKSGLGVLAAAAHAPVVPLALNYLFRHTSDPSAFAAFGDPMIDASIHRSDWGARVEERLIEGLESIDAFATTGTGAFQTVLSPRRRGDAPPAARMLNALAAPMSRGTKGHDA